MERPHYLKNLKLAKRFILRKYKIDRTEVIENLLGLYGVDYFTKGDMKALLSMSRVYGAQLQPLDQKYGLITAVDDEKKRFKITAKGNMIVEEFYDYLEGVKEMDKDSIEIRGKSDVRLYTYLNRKKK